MELLDKIKQKAKQLQKRIVLPESFEERTIQAANEILRDQIAQIVLIGKKDEILKKAKEQNLPFIEKAIFVDPKDHQKKAEYIKLLLDLRRAKGMDEATAATLVEDPLYLSTLMIKNKDADGEIAGAMNTTGNVLRPAFQIVKTLPGIKVVSGAFLMIMKDKEFGDNGLMVFADCAVHPNPTAEELAQIAVVTGKTTRALTEMEPRIAMLSFSTKGSAEHEMVTKVVEATRIAKQMDPSLQIDGELQADAAIIPSIGHKKAPGSTIAGKANVLIFPSLEVGNIAYKLVQRMAHAEAVGPVLQGLAAPINDLSRGCSVSDIVNMVAIASNQAAG